MKEKMKNCWERNWKRKSWKKISDLGLWSRNWKGKIVIKEKLEEHFNQETEKENLRENSDQKYGREKFNEISKNWQYSNRQNLECYYGLWNIQEQMLWTSTMKKW